MVNIKCRIFQGLPRESKSHTSREELAHVMKGIYLTARHEIVDQSFDKFQCPRYKTAVKMEGKSRLCKTKKLNCSTCLMRPDQNDTDHIGYFELKVISESLLLQHRKLSKNDIKTAETEEILQKYGGLCPYYVLNLAMERCNYVFTVSQVHVPWEKVDLLVIDEDTTLAYYFPQSTEICSYSHLPNSSSVQVSIPDFQHLKNQIEQKARKNRMDRDILKAVDTLEIWRKLLLAFKDGEITKEEIVENLNASPIPVFEDPSAAYRQIVQLLIADNRRVFLDAVFYPAPIRFYLETGKGSNTIYAIADGEHQIRNFPQADRVILIGATLAEKIAMEHYPDTSVVDLFNEFHYARNLAIFPVQNTQEVAVGEKTYKRVNRDKTQHFILDIAKNLYDNRIPCIIATGSERIQRQVERGLREINASPEVCQQENAHEMDDSLITARPTIVYANSSVSRGIDLDKYDSLLLYHVEFSTPYWSAMAEYWDKKDPQRAEYYRDIRERIVIDETVNLMFRIAPVKGRWEDYPKILFIPRYYMERLEARCEELGVLDKLERATSTVTLSPQDFDITHLGEILRAQIRSVVKNRENREGGTESRQNGSEVSYISNVYPDLPQNAPVLDAVREGRLVETMDEFMLDRMRRKNPESEVPEFLEPTIRDLIRMHFQTHATGSDMVPMMDIIKFVQNPPTDGIDSHREYVVLPDLRNKRGRPQKYVATRAQIRCVVYRMESDGELTSGVKRRNRLWSLRKEGVHA